MELLLLCLSRDYSLEHVRKPRQRLYAVQLRRLNQRHRDRPVTRSAVRTREQRVLACGGSWPDDMFNRCSYPSRCVHRRGRPQGPANAVSHSAWPSRDRMRRICAAATSIPGGTVYRIASSASVAAPTAPSSDRAGITCTPSIAHFSRRSGLALHLGPMPIHYSSSTCAANRRRSAA